MGLGLELAPLDGEAKLLHGECAVGLRREGSEFERDELILAGTRGDVVGPPFGGDLRREQHLV